MVLMHWVFRRELGLLPAMIGKVLLRQLGYALGARHR
jgi:hypothetical protein